MVAGLDERRLTFFWFQAHIELDHRPKEGRDVTYPFPPRDAPSAYFAIQQVPLQHHMAGETAKTKRYGGPTGDESETAVIGPDHSLTSKGR